MQLTNLPTFVALKAEGSEQGKMMALLHFLGMTKFNYIYGPADHLK